MLTKVITKAIIETIFRLILFKINRIEKINVMAAPNKMRQISKPATTSDDALAIGSRNIISKETSMLITRQIVFILFLILTPPQFLNILPYLYYTFY